MSLPLSELTLEQKASLGSGASFWTSESTPGLRAVTLTDGPHGVRVQRAGNDALGLIDSEPATCFPPSAGLGQSWDVELVERVGVALGREARALDVDVLLGPGVNIRRDPRGGRNFEYYSEDPLLSGELGTAWVRGVQSQGVGASVKHFAANNAEHDRMRSSSQVDPRALREIYLDAFERIVRRARPWTIMASYNRINGTYVAASHRLLTEILRLEWGFDGLVVSDWGAVEDRVASVAAGLDLQMPGDAPDADASVVEAVRTGRLPESAVDASARNVMTLMEQTASAPPAEPVDLDRHHGLAREAAARSIVLLKNDDDLLPLSPNGRLAVIGEFAEHPRYQGEGSSQVNANRVDIPLDEIRAAAPEAEIVYARGLADESTTAAAATAEATSAAAEADVAVVFLGLRDHEESEGFDREHIDLPKEHLDLLAAVVQSQPRTVVVLTHGGVVQLTTGVTDAAAVLDSGLLGQAGGGAIADVLFGAVNPSGRLTETVPMRLQDVPAYLNFPGEDSQVLYGESIFVGYRWYDARDMEVAYPFGHGLSYTSFAYDDLSVQVEADAVNARIAVTNTGSQAGREVVQFYVAVPDSRIRRAPQELKAFAVVGLEPGQSKEVDVTIPLEDLRYWDSAHDRWRLEAGRYEVRAAASSRDVRAVAEVELEGDGYVPELSLASTIGEALAHPTGGTMMRHALSQSGPMAAEGESAPDAQLLSMMESFPLGRLSSFVNKEGLDESLQRLITAANKGDINAEPAAGDAPEAATD